MMPEPERVSEKDLPDHIRKGIEDARRREDEGENK